MGPAMGFDVGVSATLGNHHVQTRFAGGDGITALFGPSGAGKTSVLNMVAGLLRPEAGWITVDGVVLFDAAQGVNLPPDQRRIGYVFQDARLFPHMTVNQNLLYGYRLASGPARWMTPDAAVDLLRIGHLLHRRPRELSGGEAQRVAIGRALLSGPRCLLMDEPLSSVDESRRDDIVEVIRRIATELHLPILYVTHDRREIEKLGACVVTIGEEAF